MPKKITSAFLLSVLCLAIPFLAKAQEKPIYDSGLYEVKNDTLPYRILFPENFDPAATYPLIIVLHDDADRGEDNEAQLSYGKDLFLKDEVRKQYPAIVVFPQCPQDSYWPDVKMQHDSSGSKFIFPADAKPTKAMHALMAFIGDFLDKPYVNTRKVYIGGLQMGAMGTFELISREPKVFAAAFVICGAGNPQEVKKYAKKVPVWIFCGGKDDPTTVDHVQAINSAIKAAGGEPKFTQYPNDGHDSLDEAFAEPGLLPWLFSNSK